MEPWVFVTLLAALAQTARFVLQKRLTLDGLSPVGATFARFLFAAPVVALLALIYAWASGQGLPRLPGAFWPYAVTGGLAQIGATVFTVALFGLRNFAVGVTFKKSEVLLSAAVGLIVLGDRIAPFALGAILLGLIAVLLLSRSSKEVAFSGRAVALGLGAGLLFAVSGVAYRGASLSLESGNALLRAAVTLACVTGFQTVAMAAGLGLRDPAQIGAVLCRWRVSALVAASSLVGSLCWFTAFTLQKVALVKAIGQIELLFSLAASWLIFSERVSRRELAGIALLLLSILVLVLCG